MYAKQITPSPKFRTYFLPLPMKRSHYQQFYGLWISYVYNCLHIMFITAHRWLLIEYNTM